MSIRFDPQDIEKTTFLAMTGDLKKKSVLEVGCGNGRFTQQYAHLAQKVVGIDPNADKIKQAQKKAIATTPTFLATDIQNYQTKQRFDIILFSWPL